MISEPHRAELLKLARDAITAHATGQRRPAATPGELADQRGAVFVTLHHGDHLRGCIGHLADDLPFSIVIPRCAVAAANEDPRFAPVTADEVPQLSIEISVLSPLEPISGAGDIETGRHGLVVDDGRHRGLLLPQVATEWNWNAETFLAQTCRKAGLSGDAWKHGAKIFRFEAEVFGEPHAA